MMGDREGREDRVLYWCIGGVLGLLLIVMLVSWDYDRANEEANQKAVELVAAYEAAGLRPPERPAMVARVLGDDGGAVCETAGSDVLEGLWKQRLGVGGEFYFRPVKVDRVTVEGLLLIVRTYCPDKLPDVEEFVEDLDFDDVVRS